VRIGIGADRKNTIGKKKDADKSGIGTEIIGIVRSSAIDGRRISSFQLSEIVLSATVMIGMRDPIGAITMVVGDLMGRLGGERPFTIGWGQAQCARQAWRSCSVFSQEPGGTQRDG